MLRTTTGFLTVGLAIILAGCWQVPKNYTLLHWAARENHIDIVRSLVERDVDVDAGDGTGVTSIYWAVREGNADIAQLLIDRGARIDVSDRQGMSLLHWAADHGLAETVASALREHFVPKVSGRVFTGALGRNVD